MLRELLTLNLEDYFEGVYIPIGAVVLALTLALVVFFILFSLYQSAFLTIVKQLLRANAIGEEQAKTIVELRVEKLPFVRSVVTKNQGRAAHLLKHVSQEDGKKQIKVSKNDSCTVKIYLPAESVEEAKFLCEQKNPGLAGTILICAAVLAVGLLLFFFLPDILSFLANALASE